MSKPKQHTPGPWRFHTDIPESERKIYFDIRNPVIGSDGKPTCSLVSHPNKETEQANGLLILAAPDLLEACELALSTFVEDDKGMTFPKLVKAIAKARGEE